MTLKAYTVTSDYAEANVLVFAESASKAKRSGQRSPWLQDEKWTDLQATRAPTADHHASRMGVGAVEGATAEQCRILRDLGWYEMGDGGGGQCAWCQLFQWELVPESHRNDEEICAGCLASPNRKSQIANPR